MPDIGVNGQHHVHIAAAVNLSPRKTTPHQVFLLMLQATVTRITEGSANSGTQALMLYMKSTLKANQETYDS
ncbi:hypothetical protein CEXT_749621 [Caerostris extrusa]|uniref:Uncharacterized protein n=1 Tax=Caerostris extrusa TaxID=172846 RepID=A0AAV4T6I4_CAEEX|nr:hypothetical protein CEXT_749621 [Caerostris extrusa]